MKAGLRLAGGRQLPPLVFVTDAAALSRSVGASEARAAIDAIRASGATLVDALPPGANATRAAEVVRKVLARHPEAEGVVLVGGYHVVPSQRIDTVPRRLRAGLRPTADGDDFIVWSDDCYGDHDGDGWPELPVSRLPDGHSAALLHTMLSARPRSGPSSRAPRAGVRNIHRHFAEQVFALLPGRASMQRSRPTAHSRVRPLAGERLYFMLHGSASNGRSFWGEDQRHNLREAVHTGSDASGSVVLSGCCWGALTVDTQALHVKAGRPIASRVPESSMAMSLLARGALAFVGCTGMHYSPTKPPYDYYGGPMHKSFWEGYLAGHAPARALLEAKRVYAERMPHGKRSRLSIAVEYKILRQFTCLGLGW